MATPSRFSVEYDHEFQDYHVCDSELPEATEDGSRNSLCDTKDHDRAFRVVEHLKRRHEPPYRIIVRQDGTSSVVTGGNSLLVVVNEPDRAARLLNYLEG